MPKLSKNRKSAIEKVDKTQLYAPLSAVRLAKEVSTAKFDETFEVHIRLGIDTRQADQQVRGSISLPHGTGKTVRVAVFAEGEKAREAEEAGADVVGSDDLVAQIQGGFLDFDATVATPDQMAKVGRLGKILGTRGLMPNPKLGTVTNDVARIVGELKAGRVEYRADRFGICHVPIGKASFGDFGLVRATAETIAVFEMGSSATKYMAEFLPSDKERVSRMIGLNYVFAFVSSVLVTSVFWLSVPRICDSILKAPHLAGGMRLGAVLLFCVTYSSFPDGVLAGFQDFRGLACSKLLSSLIAALVY